jgi:hypothetical protein
MLVIDREPRSEKSRADPLRVCLAGQVQNEFRDRLWGAYCQAAKVPLQAQRHNVVSRTNLGCFLLFDQNRQYSPIRELAAKSRHPADPNNYPKADSRS